MPMSTPILLGLIVIPLPSVSSHEYGIIKFPCGSTHVKVAKKQKNYKNFLHLNWFKITKNKLLEIMILQPNDNSE